MLLNLLQLLQSDDQTTYTDKVNYNFDQILAMGGGPIGPTGFQGIQGVPGAQGIQGFQGLPGMDGSRWYVLPSTSTPTTPTPKIGDLWLQTDTLAILEYLGSPPMWVNLGFTLASTGVFTAGGANNLVFTSPSPLRSLVLSPINYGIGNDSPGAADYRLKIVTSSGSPMIRFAVDDAGSESTPTTTQPTISVQKINNVLYPGSTNWRLNVEDLNGDIFLNLNGNYFGVYPQIASVSRFDFGAQTRLQNNAVDRLLSFAVSNTGTEFFHIGRHTGLATTADRLFSIKDNGQISIGDAFSNPIGATNYHIDSINDDLAKTGPPPPVDWLRLRGRVQNGGTTWDSLNINHNRLFSDTGSPAQRSTMIRIQHQVNSSLYHFVGFTGGADNTSASFRPQLRLGFTNSYYFAADVNGRIGIGSTSFIQKYNSGANTFQPKLTIEGSGATVTTGNSAWSGIHLIHPNVVDAQVGITSGGLGVNENLTFAGIHFKDKSSQIIQGVDIEFATARYFDAGEITRHTITREGNHYWYSKNDPNTFLLLEPGGLATPNDFMHISAYNQTTLSWKDIIFNRGTDFTGYGDGFVGIGGDIGFGDQVAASVNLANNPAQTYVALTVCTFTVYPFFGFPFSGFINAGDIFTSSSFPDVMNLDSGTVARAKPQSKLHVNESVTFGTRLDGLYSFVGTNSFTVGNTHRASGLRSIILGGVGHTASGQDGIIIGWSGGAGITMPDPNKVLLATTTHVSTVAPSTLVSSPLYTDGEQNTFFGVPAQYVVTGAPILNPSISIPTSGFGISGQIGRYGSVLTLEGRTDTAQLANVAVAMEFHIKNVSNTKRILASINAQYTEVTPGTPIGFLSFAVLKGPAINSAGVGASGALAEALRLTANGTLQFIPTDPSMKSKLTVAQNQKTGGPGYSLFLTGGFANTTGGPAAGGNLFIDAGLGGAGGANGGVAIGVNFSTANITVGTTSVSTTAIVGATASLASTTASVVTQSADVSVTGNMRHVRPTWESFSVSSFVNGSGGATLTIIADNVKVHHGGGTNTNAVTLFSFIIDPAPFDRMIYWLGGNDASIAQSAGAFNAVEQNKGQIFMHLYRFPYGGGDIIQRTYTTMYGGGNFIVPANQSMKVLMETGPIEGVRSFFRTATGHDFLFRQAKFGL